MIIDREERVLAHASLSAAGLQQCDRSSNCVAKHGTHCNIELRLAATLTTVLHWGEESSSQACSRFAADIPVMGTLRIRSAF